MRVARRRMIRALRSFIAFITCSREKEEVVLSEKEVDELVSLCMKWRRSTGSVSKLAKMLTSLRDMIAAEVEERYGKHIARTHGDFLKETLPGFCKFKEAPVQTAALELLETLGLSDDASTYLATNETFKLCVGAIKSKNKPISVAASAALTTLVNHEDTRYLASDEGLDKSMTNLITEKSLGVRAKRNCVVTFARLADDPEVASLMSAKNPEQLLKNFLDFVDKTEDTDTEKWALIAIARLALNDEFSDLMAKKGHVPHLFELSRDKIPARKLAAALVIANMARNKNLRETLVKYRAIQLFCTIAMNTSERVDMAEMQLVAALGLKNLASNFELRALAGKTGAIAACIFMMKSQQAEVQRYAALAIAELALYEPNGTKFCKGGVLKWIVRLARSGDVRSEMAAITALNNLMLSPENQSMMIAEDGTKLVDFLTNSRNPRVAHIAKTLLKRLRMAKLRAACKFAARLKATGNALIEKGVTIGEPDSGPK
jgi:hypothetical protein